MGKYLVTAIAVCIIYGQASAQIEKGKLYPGITINQGRGLQFGIQPSMSVGLGKHGLLGVHSSHLRGDNFFYNDSKTYAIKNGGGISYSYFRYFKNSRKLGWYITGELNYHRYNVYQVKNDERLLNNRYGQTDIDIRPGLFFNASKNILLFANVGGIGLHSVRDNNSLDLSFGRQVNIGILINLDAFRKRK